MQKCTINEIKYETVRNTHHSLGNINLDLLKYITKLHYTYQEILGYLTQEFML